MALVNETKDVGKPFKFKGDSTDRTRAQEWLYAVSQYVDANNRSLNTDDLKVIFALNHMEGGPAGQWATEKTRTAMTKQTDKDGTWTQFVQDFKKAFISTQIGIDKRHELFK